MTETGRQRYVQYSMNEGDWKAVGGKIYYCKNEHKFV